MKDCFKIRISLVSPNGYSISDRTYKLDDEIEARDKNDIINMIMDKNYFESLKEYEDVLKAISYILQGYEYSTRPIPRQTFFKFKRN